MVTHSAPVSGTVPKIDPAKLDDEDLDRHDHAHDKKECRVAGKKRRHPPVHRPAVEPVNHCRNNKGGKETEAISAPVCPPRNPVLAGKAGDDEKGAGYHDRDCHEWRDDRGITRNRSAVGTARDAAPPSKAQTRRACP